MKQGKKINNDLQSTTQKTKDWATRTPPNKTGVHSCNMYILSLSIIMISLMQSFSENNKNSKENYQEPHTAGDCSTYNHDRTRHKINRKDGSSEG